MAELHHATVAQPPKTRIVILGGGFGGVYTARHLERLCKRRPEVEIVLVSRDNFLLMTPLLFEVCSGTLDLRHCAFPIRAFLRTTRFGESTLLQTSSVNRIGTACICRNRIAARSARPDYRHMSSPHLRKNLKSKPQGAPRG